MTGKVQPIPAGYHTAAPYLIVNDGHAALDYYKNVFGAEVTELLPAPNGRVGHAEYKIGDSMFMLGEHADVEPAKSEKALPRVSIYLYVEDADLTTASAVSFGGKLIAPVTQKFYGNREGGVEDPFGIVWWVATRVEELTPGEIQKRAAAAVQGG